MWLTSVSIRRPVFILMVFAALGVLGLYAVARMNLELNPRVDFPFVSVVTVYPGAGPEEIESQVSKKIEDAVASVNGIKAITSTSQEGSSVVAIEFNIGVRSEVAAADVREKVAAIRSQLPRDTLDPIVSKFDSNSQPILYYGLTGNRPGRELRDLADNVIKPRLSQISGVAAVNVTGGDVREISVSVKKERLDAYGIGIQQLVGLLAGNNLNFPVGRIKEGNREYGIRVVGEFTSTQQIQDTRLRMPNGQTVRLGDLATVEDTIKERRDTSRINRVDSVSFVIQKTSDANTVAVAHNVHKEIDRLKKELPKDLKFTVSSDSSIAVEEAVTDVRNSLFLGSFLAIVIVFLFLHNIRGTFIVAIAIPTSIMSTFLVMYALGFTLNTMTMLALSLAVGILVDDAIVVLENIYRHLSMGEEPVEAAINGRSEIGLAAITITMVDVVVFVPIAFMGGIVGQFFQSFGITVAVATLFSLFVSFTLTPMLASRWYRPGEGVEAKRGVFGLINRFYTWLEHIYRSTLAWALKYRGIVVYTGSGLLVLVFLAIVGSFSRGYGGATVMAGIFLIGGLILNWRYKVLGLLVTAGGVAAVFAAYTIGIMNGKPLLLFRFAPDQDQGQVSVIGELPAGTAFEKTLVIAKQVENIVAEVKDVENTFTVVGATSGSFGGASNVGPQYFTMTLKLRPKVSLLDSVNPVAKTENMRRRADTKVADEIRQRIGKFPGATIKVAAVTGFGGGGAPLQVDIKGNNINELNLLAERVLQVIKEEPGVLNADITTRIGKPEQQIVIDREKAAAYGMSVAQVSNALRVSLEGDDSVEFRDKGNEYKVRVHFQEEDRQNTERIRDIVVGSVPGSNGSMQPVRLGDVARVFLASGPTKIDRRDRQRLVSVTANVAPGFAPGNMQINIDEKLKNISFGMNAYTWGGENKVQQDEQGFIGGALLLSIILTYMLMAALFDNLLYPLIIMLALPQALIGALLGLMAAGHALTVVAMIGVIMLVGLVAKNAILVVDYTNTLRERGLSRTEAILEAGPTRLRPILMTTLAMVFGTLPTALGLGRGAEFRAPLATPVIGGLALSTMLTLLVIPCVYTYFDDFSRFVSRRIFRRKLVEEETKQETRPRVPEPVD